MSENDKKVILEYFDDKFAMLVESLGAMIDIKLAPIANDVAELKTDTKVVKLVVTQTNKDLKKLEKRVTKLEKAVFA